MNDDKHHGNQLTEQSEVFQEKPVESPSENYLVVETLQRMPSLLSRGLLYLIILLLVCGLIYSLVGTIDVVSECRAVVTPTTNQLSIQARRSGYIQKVFVSEGQMVAQDAPLFSISLPEPTMNRAEIERKSKTVTDDTSATHAPPSSIPAERPPDNGGDEIVRAPREGTVIKLFIKNPGNYVEKFDLLCTILPAQSQFFMDILVTNQDIGFIEKDMQIKYKFDAFPYTDCGLLYGRVTSIPSAAVEDKRFGPVYHVKGTLGVACFDIRGKSYSLKAGMTATAELVRERKSIFSILFTRLRG